MTTNTDTREGRLRHAVVAKPQDTPLDTTPILHQRDFQAYRDLCEIWASPEWIEKSNRNRHRQRHQQDRDDDEVVVNHTYGVDGHIRLTKRMVSM
jgi:hypothetical protein